MSSAGANWRPGGLWSLWDMLRVYAQQYLNMGSTLADMSAHFSLRRTATPEKAAEYDQSFLTDLQTILDLCRPLGLNTAVTLIEPRVKKIRELPQSEGELDLLIEAIFADLKNTLFLFVPSHRASYYESDKLVSDKVIEAFPGASEEIRLSGTSLAAGLNTACVFHAMRAVELGMKALGAAVQIKIKGGKPIEMAEWREILDGLATAMRDLENAPNSTPNKDADLAFYSEVSAQFRFFKNGWRIRVMHARASYDEAQAKEVIDHVRSFFETLAERLKETP